MVFLLRQQHTRHTRLLALVLIAVTGLCLFAIGECQWILKTPVVFLNFRNLVSTLGSIGRFSSGYGGASHFVKLASSEISIGSSDSNQDEREQKFNSYKYATEIAIA